MAAAGVSEPMSEDAVTIINMEDMAVVFSVTDDFGIHRESVSVDLAREDPGEVSVTERGTVEITLPASRTPQPTSRPPSEPSWSRGVIRITPARWSPTTVRAGMTKRVKTIGWRDQASPQNQGRVVTRPCRSH